MAKQKVVASVLVSLGCLFATPARSEEPARAIRGWGTPGFLPQFSAPNIIGNSVIAQGDGFVEVLSPFKIRSNFPGGGPTLQVENDDPSGDIAIDFTSGGKFVGNVGWGMENRFIILANGDTPVLSLAENGASVGIGTGFPTAKLDVAGSVHVSGDLVVDGAKSSVAKLPDGRRVALYALESPENRFEDFGNGQLANGAVWVQLDSTFKDSVNTKADYHVYLTPNGDCNGLYVSAKTASGFEVRELGKGKSNIAFDYRVVARRLGYENVRLQELSR